MIKNKMIGNENESEIELDLNSKFSKKMSENTHVWI